jgi:hypothetical protein
MKYRSRLGTDSTHWRTGQAGEDVVGEVCRRLDHTPGIAGGTYSPALAGEGHQKVVSAVAAAGAGKAVREDAALQIPLERFAHIGLGAVVALAARLARAGQLKPRLVVLGHRLVEQRAFGVTRVVEFGLGGGRHGYCANTQYSAAVVRARKAQSPIRCRIGLCEIGLKTGLLLRRRQVLGGNGSSFAYSGFAGGWLGVGIDEWGGFATNPQAVGARGSATSNNPLGNSGNLLTSTGSNLKSPL